MKIRNLNEKKKSEGRFNETNHLALPMLLFIYIDTQTHVCERVHVYDITEKTMLGHPGPFDIDGKRIININEKGLAHYGKLLGYCMEWDEVSFQEKINFI